MSFREKCKYQNKHSRFISVFDSHGVDNLFHPFDSLKQLKYLDMSNCSIDALPYSIFARNVALQQLRYCLFQFFEVK